MGYLGYVNEGDVYVIDIAQGSTSRVTRTGGASRPKVSPGGQFVAFSRNNALVIAHTDGSAEYQVPNGSRPETARWSFYNTALVYTTADGALMTYDPRVGENGARQIDPPGSGVGTTAVWAASGARIAFERRRPVRDGYSREGIWVVDTTTRNPVASPVYMTAGSTGLRLCCWTGNDQFILFWQVPLSEDAPGAVGRLLIAAASSSEPVELTASSLMLRALVGAGGTGAVTPMIDGGEKPQETCRYRTDIGAEWAISGQTCCLGGVRAALPGSASLATERDDHCLQRRPESGVGRKRRLKVACKPADMGCGSRRQAETIATARGHGATRGFR